MLSANKGGTGRTFKQWQMQGDITCLLEFSCVSVVLKIASCISTSERMKHVCCAYSSNSSFHVRTDSFTKLFCLGQRISLPGKLTTRVCLHTYLSFSLHIRSICAHLVLSPLLECTAGLTAPGILVLHLIYHSWTYIHPCHPHQSKLLCNSLARGY